MFDYTLTDSSGAVLEHRDQSDLVSVETIVERSQAAGSETIDLTISGYHIVGADGFEARLPAGVSWFAHLTRIDLQQHTSGECFVATYAGNLQASTIEYKEPVLYGGEFHKFTNGLSLPFEMRMLTQAPPVPMVSWWGVVGIGLLVFTAAALVLRGRRFVPHRLAAPRSPVPLVP